MNPERAKPNRDRVQDSRRLRRMQDALVRAGRFKNLDRTIKQVTVTRNSSKSSTWRELWQALLGLLKRLRIKDSNRPAYRYAVEADEIRILEVGQGYNVEWTSACGKAHYVNVSARNPFIRESSRLTGISAA